VLAPAVEAILAEPVDAVVFLTGVGAGLIFDYARRLGLSRSSGTGSRRPPSSSGAPSRAGRSAPSAAR